MELRGPSEAEIKKIIKFETKMEFVTVADHHFRGILLWADQSAYHLKLENERTITILKTAVLYYTAM